MFDFTRDTPAMLIRGHGDWSIAHPGRCYPLDPENPTLIGGHPVYPIRASTWTPVERRWRVFEDRGAWYLQPGVEASQDEWGPARRLESSRPFTLEASESVPSTFYLVDASAEPRGPDGGPHGAMDGAYRRLVQTHGLFLDPLTGVFHKAYLRHEFQQQIEGIRRSGGSLWGLLIDLDHFKRLNDFHGFAIGDAVLGDVAATIRRRTDVDHLGVHKNAGILADPGKSVSCGRHAGNRFLVLMGGASRDQAVARAETIRRDVAAASLEYDGPEVSVEVTVTVSIGVLEWREPWSERHWLERLENALFAAKIAGRDQVFIAPER